MPTIALMFVDPSFPGGDPFLHLCAPFFFGERVPGHHARAGLVAGENREVCVVRAHDDFLPLCIVGMS
jgi:hypothetical protein